MDTPKDVSVSLQYVLENEYYRYEAAPRSGIEKRWLSYAGWDPTTSKTPALVALRRYLKTQGPGDIKSHLEKEARTLKAATLPPEVQAYFDTTTDDPEYPNTEFPGFIDNLRATVSDGLVAAMDAGLTPGAWAATQAQELGLDGEPSFLQWMRQVAAHITLTKKKAEEPKQPKGTTTPPSGKSPRPVDSKDGGIGPRPKLQYLISGGEGEMKLLAPWIIADLVSAGTPKALAQRKFNHNGRAYIVL